MDVARMKEVSVVDGREILQQLERVAVERWVDGSTQSVQSPHLSPRVKDFKTAFYPGRDENVLTTLEVDGVTLAAIKGMHGLMKEKDEEARRLQARVQGLEAQVAELRMMVEGLVKAKR